MARTWTRLEDRIQAWTRDRARLARAFQIAYWISMIVVVLGLALVVAHYARGQAGGQVVLASPSSAGASVELDGTTSAWNGASAHEVAPADASVVLWVPGDARLHRVTLAREDGSLVDASWRAEGAQAIRVLVPRGANASSARAEFDLAPPSVARLADYVAPDDLVLLTMHVTAPNGSVVRVETPDGAAREGSELTLELRDVRAGSVVTLRVLDADAVGELPLLVSLLVVAVLVFLGTLAWHAFRPPAPRDRSQMRFLDHLGELQARLVPPVVVFAFLNIFYFVAGLRIVHVGGASFVVPWLTDSASMSQQGYQALADRLVPAGVQLVAIRPIDAVLAQVQVALFLAFVSVLPLVVYEIVVFVGPALRERERRIALRTLPAISLLFVAGALFGYLLMAPLMLRTLYAYAPTVGARPLLVVGDLVSFALLVVASFGLAFELPVFMFAFARLGLVRARTFWKYFRHAIVVIFVVAGIITPDPSVVSQLLVGVPVTLLYALGIAAAAWGERAHARRQPPGPHPA